MSDYSVYRWCQWLVKPARLRVRDRIEGQEPRRRLCHKRARFAIGKWTWLCKQHATIAHRYDPSVLLDRITTVAGRPDGEL
jgi:hypothetical protein